MKLSGRFYRCLRSVLAIRKKSILGGFSESPLRLNKFIREQSEWTSFTIEQRGEQLAKQALEVWRPLLVDPLSVKQYELDDYKSLAAKFKTENVEFDELAKQLFDTIRPQICALGNDVVELPNARSVIYRVFDSFVEVIPRRQRLLLLLNMQFAECDDPSDKSEDATQYAFIIGATTSGGVIYTLQSLNDVSAALST